MKTTVETFIARVSDEMRKSGQYSASKTCLTVLHGLLDSAGKPVLPFCRLTPELLLDYEHRLMCRGCARNSISLYMRTLHTLCHKAEECGVAKVSDDLFDKVFTGYESPSRRSVPADVMQQLRAATLEGKSRKYAFARDLFLLCFYLRGIAFIDLAYLRKCDLKEGVLSFCRRKTGKQARVLVEPCAMEVIRRYSPDSATGYLLPIIRRAGDSRQERKQYESALRLYNKHLKVLAVLLHLDVKLTSYVPRHTWATTAHDIGVDMSDISEALCHSSEKMTRNYIRSFTPDRLAGVNRRVIACIGVETEKRSCKGKRRDGKLPGVKFRSGSL